VGVSQLGLQRGLTGGKAMRGEKILVRALRTMSKTGHNGKKLPNTTVLQQQYFVSRNIITPRCKEKKAAEPCREGGERETMDFRKGLKQVLSKIPEKRNSKKKLDFLRKQIKN